MTDLNNTTAQDQDQAAAAAVKAKTKKAKTTVAKADLTVDFLKSRLELRGEDFYWLVDGVVVKAGDFAGARRELDGYYSVVLAGTNYSGKQLAYFYENGTWPVRIPAGEKVKAVREAKPHTPRVAPVITAESKALARAEAKAKADAKKAAKAEAEAAAAAQGGAEQGAEQAASDTSDIETQTL